jgi:hypothetical protein
MQRLASRPRLRGQKAKASSADRGTQKEQRRREATHPSRTGKQIKVFVQDLSGETRS